MSREQQTTEEGGVIHLNEDIHWHIRHVFQPSTPPAQVATSGNAFLLVVDTGIGTATGTSAFLFLFLSANVAELDLLPRHSVLCRRVCTVS